MASIPQIILYHYTTSPYARRIEWYLLLRELPYSECIQPMLMPRPDLARLGVRHRRIPVLAIGRDVYVDTRLMLRKLEQISAPGVRPPLGVGRSDSRSSNAELLALERLLDHFTADGTLFPTAVRLIPPSAPVLRDPAFLADRASFSGTATRTTSKKTTSVQEASLARAEALVDIRYAATLLETTLLVDGRNWVLGTPTPSLADIEAVWIFYWLRNMPGSFHATFVPLGNNGRHNQLVPRGDASITPVLFPRLFAWMARFAEVINAAATTQGCVPRLDGAQAAAAVFAALRFESEIKGSNSGDAVDANDPVTQAAKLQVGDRVLVWPTDTGSTHKDIGTLVRLQSDEVVIAVEVEDDKGASTAAVTPVHLHAPRHGFRVRPLANGQGLDHPNL